MNMNDELRYTHELKSPDNEGEEMATLFVVSAVQFLTPFMLSAVSVALPAIGREFSASAVQLGLIETVYILAFSMLLLPAGRMGDLYGRKRIFTIGIAIFTIGTVLVSRAVGIESFIVFRFFQGGGGAMITGTSVAILSSVFPPAKRGKAMGFIVSCVYIGLSAGPVIGGYMVSHMGWRYIFYFAVLVELAALALTLSMLKGEWAEARGERFDWVGAVIYCFSLLCFVYGALHQKEGIAFQGLMTGGALGLCGFLFFEYRAPSPILDVSLLIHNRVFAFSNLATLINYAASFGIGFYFSLYLQYVKGFTPKAAGSVLIIQPVVQAFLSPVFGRLADRFSPALLATLGMGICAAGLGGASMIQEGTPVHGVMAVLVVMGTGFGIFASPNMTAVMGSVASKHYGIASSFVATMRTLGMLLCMTVITLIFGYFMGKQPVSHETRTAFLVSMHVSMVIFSVLCVVGVLCSMGRIKGLSKK